MVTTTRQDVPPGGPRSTEKETAWWVVALMFFLGWVFIYADRTILNPLLTDIGDQYGLDKAGLGLLNSVFFLTYALVQVPSGILGDKYGRLKFIILGFLIFGAFTGITGLATGVGVLFLYRAMAGFGQGFYYGPQYSLSGEMIPEKHRTVGTALINSGQAVGITIGLVGSSYFAYTLDLGWRAPFFIYAIPTILVGGLIWYFIKEPAKPVDRGDEGPKPTLRSLFGIRNLVLTFIMVFCSIYGFFVVITWLPTYLEEIRGIDRSNTGALASIAAWSSIPASIVIALVADRIGRRRPLLMMNFAMAIASVFLLIYAPNIGWVIVSLVLYGFFGKLATDPLLVSLCGIYSPRQITATAFGLFNFIGMSSAILAPYVTGFLVDRTGNWDTGFYLTIGLLVIALVTSLFLDERSIPKKEAVTS